MIDGLVFHPPYESSEPDINYYSKETNKEGSGKLLDPRAYVTSNSERGDIYVYAHADTLGDVYGACSARAGHYVKFNIDRSTDYLEVETKIHTVGGKCDSVTGMSETKIYFGHF